MGFQRDDFVLDASHRLLLLAQSGPSCDRLGCLLTPAEPTSVAVSGTTESWPFAPWDPRSDGGGPSSCAKHA
jgi:hypothetical protein